MNTFSLSPVSAARYPDLPLPMDRRFLVVTAVVGFHLLGLWTLQAGLLHRAVALVIPVHLLVDVIELPQPVITPAPAATAPTKPALPQAPPSLTPTPAPVTRPAPQPVALATPVPAPQVPSPVATAKPIAADTAAPVTQAAANAPPAPAAPAASAAPRVELPSSSADYLSNPPPPYPPLSKRLGEQGQVVVRARIEANGTASQAEIRTSSGFDRLDQAALQTVKRWRYVPGKRAGVPEPMWFNIPIRFVLE